MRELDKKLNELNEPTPSQHTLANWLRIASYLESARTFIKLSPEDSRTFRSYIDNREYELAWDFLLQNYHGVDMASIHFGFFHRLNQAATLMNADAKADAAFEHMMFWF